MKQIFPNIKKPFLCGVSLILFWMGGTLANAQDYLNVGLVPVMTGDPSSLTISDVLDPQKTDPKILSTYGEISLPAAGGDGSIQPSHVLLTLARAGADLSNIRLVTSADTVVKPSYRADVINLIKEKSFSAISKIKKEDSKNLSIVFTNIPNDLPERDAFDDLDVEISRSENSNDIQNFFVRFKTRDGRTMATASLQGRLSIKRQVVVAKRTILPGEIVTQSDFKEQESQLGDPDGFVLSLKELGQSRWRVGEEISEGSIVKRNALNFSAKMEKGSIVTLLVGDKRFQIRSVGRVKEVLDDGLSVLVENMDSKKELIGKPISANEVRVIY